MTISFQQLRSAIPGAQPSQLDAGQVAFNVSDGTMYLGTGSDVKIDFSGTAVIPAPPAGKGWIQVLLEREALNEFFVANPVSEGRPVPTNEQVLTWNSNLGAAEWQDAGTGFSYQTTNAAVTASTGADTSAKITAAIGNPSYIGRNATCIVVGDPGTVYEGLYIYSGTAWVFGAHYAFNTASQVPAVNPMTLSAAATQAVLNALKLVDDGLQSQITSNDGDIATLQGQMATAQTDINNLEVGKLDKASNVPFAGQILSYDGTGQLWIDHAPGDVTSVTGTSPITVDNTDPENPIVGINAASTSAPGAVQLSTSLSSTSITEATTPFAVKAVNDVAVAAIPRATYAAEGDIVVGTGAGTFGPLGVGSDGQVLTVVSGIPAWTDDAPGDVTSVTGSAPITVNNADPENPVVGVNLATTATPGVVQVELTGNLTLVSGVINVPDASTTVKGAVQLNNTTSSNSTTQALTAAQGLALQQEINTLSLANSVTLAGGWDAVNGAVDGTTSQGVAAGFVNGGPLPAPGTVADYYLICVVPGTDPSAMENGDWLLSDGTTWQVLGVGARPGSASYTQQGIVQLADAAAVVDGTSDTLAITPQALQDNVVDAVNITNSSQIASATAVKTAYDAGVQGQTDAAAALAVANAALPKAGGTMTGTISAHNVNIQSTFSLQFAGGVNGSLNAVTDATNVTSSTTAASATAVKAAYDAGAQGQTDAAAAQADADQALLDAAAAQSTADQAVLDAAAAQGTADQAVLDAAAAQGTADQAVLDAAAAQATADAAIPDATFTTAGQLLYGTGAGTYSVLPIGTNGQSLIVSAGAIAWGASLQGYTNTATPFNTALGANAGDSITTAVNNTAIGYNAGTANLTGNNNTFVGFAAGDATTSDNNTALGSNALGGGGVNNNTAVGFNAGCSLTTGGSNTFVGAGAGDQATTADGSVAIGYNALGAVATGVGSIAIGLNALAVATSAARTTAVGYAAMDALTTGNNNTALGYSALGAVVTGTDNTAIGNDALLVNTGSFNTAVGSIAADAITTGSCNVSVGYSAHGSATTPSQSVAIGVSALQSSSATGSVAIGHQAALNSSSGVVTAVGFCALRSVTTGTRNTAFGNQAGLSIIGGSDNTLVGDLAGDVLTGSNNTFVGSSAGGSATVGNDNTFVGKGAGSGVTTGFANVLIGGYAGTTTLSNNVVLSDGSANIKLQINENGAVGVGTAPSYGTAGQVLTSSGTGSAPTWTTPQIGDITAVTAGTGLTGGGTSGDVSLSLDSACVIAPTLLTSTGDIIYASAANTPARLGIGTSGQILTVVGGVPTWSGSSLAGYTCSATPFSTALGSGAGAALTSNSVGNTALGYNTLDVETTGDFNVAVGHNALTAQNGGSGNTALGANAGAAITNGLNNTLVGCGSGDALTSGQSNVAIGQNSLGSATASTNNVAIGQCAMANATATAGSTIAIGVGALSGLTSGGGNIAIGTSALTSLTSGGANTIIGNLAGDALSSGGSNTVVGCGALGTATTASGNTAIGSTALASATGGGNTAVGNGAGTGITTGSCNTLIGGYAGTTTMSNNVVLSDGAGNIKLQVNENGAVGVGTTPGYGTAGQVLTSGGTAAAPTWTTVSGGGLTGITSAVTTALGNNALDSITDPGVLNTAVGIDAGTAITTGDQNTLVGYQAGQALTVNSANVLMGHQAGVSLTGEGNVGIGSAAGPTGGATNSTFLGAGAGNIASGNSNVGIGSGAAAKATGNFNTAVGASAGSEITSGASNTFVGNGAGRTITTGSNNTIIGRYTGGGDPALSNNVVISAGASDIKLVINDTDAVSFGGLSNFGTAGQILMSNGGGAAPTWTSSAGLLPAYGAFLGTLTQTNTGGVDGNIVDLDTTLENRDISVVTNSIVFSRAGTYNIQISLQVQKTDAGKDDFFFWFKKNNVNVPSSATNMTLQGNDEAQLAALNYVATFAPDDSLSIWWYSADVNIQLLAEPATAPYPAIPAAIVTVVPVGA